MAMLVLPPSVSVVHGRGGLTAVRVTTPACTGEVYLHGAHITEWTPIGAEPVLWVGENAEFAEGKPIRGGIPICLPWFGLGIYGDVEPRHGFGRITEWDLAEATEDGDSTTLTFRLVDPEKLKAPGAEDFPHDVSFTYEVRFGPTLDLKLTTHTGSDAMVLEEAFHTYFAVSDVRQVTITGLDGATYTEQGSSAKQVQSGELQLTGETDRLYRSKAAVDVVDPGRGRTLRTEKKDSANTVVWNPWSEKAASMPDLGEEWTSMVCVEAANVLDDAEWIFPGASVTMAVRISVV